MIKKNFKLESIDKSEVWRYLGRRNQKISPELESLTRDVIDETLTLVKPMAVYEFGVLGKNNETLTLLGSSLPGEAISDLLRDSSTGYLLAATLGFDIDKRIRQYEITDMTRAVLMDACASALIEDICDQVNDQIDDEIKLIGKFTTERFSPGYSDLPLEIQPSILHSLDTNRKIGLSCSESCLLFPRKSVTAIIGVLDKPREPRGLICKDCILRKNCKFGICRRKI